MALRGRARQGSAKVESWPDRAATLVRWFQLMQAYQVEMGLLANGMPNPTGSEPQ